MFSYPKVVPQLVEDVSLKRARTEINGDDAIRVVTTNGGGSISVDAQDFADGTGLAPTQTYAGSINHKLIALSANSTTNTQNITSLSTTLGQTSDTSASASIMGVLKNIGENIPSASDLSTVDAKTTALATSIGETTDTSSDPTVIGILKDIKNNLPSNADFTTVNTNTNSLVTTVGTINTTTGTINTDTTALATSIGNTTDTSSDPTVIGILKDITSSLPSSADLTTVNTNTGSLVTTTGAINTTTGTIDTTTTAMNTTLGTINSTQGSVSDAAWSGTGDATVISLLKGIVNKLN